jgi:hypothetical protein
MSDDVGDLVRAADAMIEWILEYVDDLTVHQYLCEIHPDDYKEAAEVAIRAARGEADPRPFTMRPDLPR